MCRLCVYSKCVGGGGRGRDGRAGWKVVGGDKKTLRLEQEGVRGRCFGFLCLPIRARCPRRTVVPRQTALVIFQPSRLLVRHVESAPMVVWLSFYRLFINALYVLEVPWRLLTL